MFIHEPIEFQPINNNNFHKNQNEWGHNNNILQIELKKGGKDDL